ncbi:class I SAM-dependent methyltransferase [Gallibacterium trehalosifermentans]|uniref:Class I SAM-dependent methyltransferase n=1 Tax=Gallibacterium trehalosifermentans TaxID=516935 RepID=A0ABV6H2P2_9PAST
MQKSVYDQAEFFELYQKLRNNPISLNEIVEKPTMFQLVGNLTGKRVLDLGCGMGVHLQHYLQQGAKYAAGIDLSEKMLQQASTNLQHAGITTERYNLYPLAMEQLADCPDNQFDLVTSSFAFHYIADFPVLLQQIAAKLTPNGQLIFSQEHPIVTCYQSGERWEKDQNKQQIAYRLNYYREEGLRQRNWFKQPFKTYHRKLSTILNDLIQAGFTIQQVAEPMLDTQPEWQQEFKDLQHRPVLLFVKAQKC